MRLLCPVYLTHLIHLNTTLFYIKQPPDIPQQPPCSSPRSLFSLSRPLPARSTPAGTSLVLTTTSASRLYPTTSQQCSFQTNTLKAFRPHAPGSKRVSRAEASSAPQTLSQSRLWEMDVSIALLYKTVLGDERLMHDSFSQQLSRSNKPSRSLPSRLCTDRAMSPIRVTQLFLCPPV